MMETINWQIPASLFRRLQSISLEQPVALLLRHSVRDFLPPGDAGYSFPINEAGVRLALELGTTLAGRLRTLHSSPLLRCMQTAEALAQGAEAQVPVVPDRLLGDPGVYVLDGSKAWKNWETRGHEGVMEHLVSARQPLPGMARTDIAARHLVHHMLAVANGMPGLHVFVTHDSLVTATAAQLLDQPLGPDAWPWYLEGAFFWREREGVAMSYRDWHRSGIPQPLCALEEADVIEFARREVAGTVGLDSGARFFLAGGAFKTLLTGRPPRDLDLWAASAEDRAALIRKLEQRGAERLPARPFADAFEIAGRIVEVPFKVEPTTLAGRLAKFDIGLSAVGAEHHSDGAWFALVHPLARLSVRKRQVLLLKPLVNWKFALTTLERMRRYEQELGFSVPEEEEAEIWRVLEAQPPEMRRDMLDRYSLVAMGGYQVAEEAVCRFP